MNDRRTEANSGKLIRMGISTCPNDTFAFHALLNRLIDCRGYRFHIELLDIQQLNDRLQAGHFDLAKVSFHAALLLADRYLVMPTGSALGFGVGPLLLAARGEETPESPAQVTLCPGPHTTATLLFRLFYPQTTEIRHVVFSEIMPLLMRRAADFGVCIHEGRFVWEHQGLTLIEDLGTRWEQVTGCPLPLGGLIARKDLPPEVLGDLQAIIAESLDYALANRTAPLETMRRYAQEFDDEVLMRHVDLYVNDWTRDLGEEGRRALDELNRAAKQAGVIEHSGELQVFEI